MREMGNNRQKELKETAEGRVEEVVSKLCAQAAHDVELQLLLTSKVGLVTNLSDLEGELLSSCAARYSIPRPPRCPRGTDQPQRRERLTKNELGHMPVRAARNLEMNEMQE